MSKDKKVKKAKKERKGKDKNQQGLTAIPAEPSASGKRNKKTTTKGTDATERLKALTENPLVADVVAAALVATAAALKDSKKAGQLAEQAGDDLAALKDAGAERGKVLWDLALEIGRRTVAELVGDGARKTSSPPKSK